MNSDLRNITRNLLSGWITIAVRFAIGLILVPLIIERIGVHPYGMLGLIGVLVGLTVVADFGLRNALGRELVESIVKGDRQQFTRLISTSTVLFLGIALAIISLVNVFAGSIVTFLGIERELASEGIRLIRVYGSISILFSFMTPVFSSVLIANKRYDIVNIVDVLSSITVNLALYLILRFTNAGVWAWAWAQIAAQVLILAAYVRASHRICTMPLFSAGEVGMKSLVPLFRLGGKIYLIQLTQTISEKSDPVVISAFFGTAGVALYEPATKATFGLRPIVLMLISQLYPYTTEQHVRGDEDRLRRLLILGTRYTLLLGLPLSVCIVMYAFPFCRLWLSDALGPAYRTVALIMAGWAISDVTHYCGGSQWPVLLAMKKLKFIVVLLVISSIVNILVSIYIVGYTPIGVPGVILATVGVGVILRPILTVYTSRACGCGLKRYMRESYMRPVFASLLTACAVLVLRLTWPIENWVDLGIHGLIALTAAGISAWVAGMTKEDRFRIREAIGLGRAGI